MQLVDGVLLVLRCISGVLRQLVKEMTRHRSPQPRGVRADAMAAMIEGGRRWKVPLKEVSLNARAVQIAGGAKIISTKGHPHEAWHAGWKASSRSALSPDDSQHSRHNRPHAGSQEGTQTRDLTRHETPTNTLTRYTEEGGAALGYLAKRRRQALNAPVHAC